MFKVYTKPRCVYCLLAKKDLESSEYDYIAIDGIQHKDELLSLVPDFTTYPQIFKDDVYIGGYSELAEYLRTP